MRTPAKPPAKPQGLPGQFDSNGRDRRYTVTREYCGYPRPRHVARFCGEWLGQGAFKSDATSIAQRHAEARDAVLQGLSQ